MPLSFGDLEASASQIASRWRAERAERQTRRHLDRSDFDRLRNAGLFLAAVPAEAGGLWTDRATSLRSLCEVHRRLAAGDPSVALVASMHPSVLAFWLSTETDDDPEWEAQRNAVFASAVSGEQWGTITSEPGSGGDIARTRSIASPTDDLPFLVGRSYAVSGDKHFGSGSGVTDRMITSAIPAGEEDPTIFVLDVRDRPWDGSQGLELVAEWDGMGMRATQSHAMRLDGAPAVRLAWGGPLEAITMAAAPFIAPLFTSVVLGVLDEAVAVARAQLRGRADQLRPFEQVEWSRAEQDHWLAVQAFEGGLRSATSEEPLLALHGTLRAKEAVAELAERSLRALTRVLGGGTFSQRSPYSHWFEDVRALGFLRPPWGLAYDHLFATSFAPADGT